MSYDQRPWLKSYDPGVGSDIEPVDKTLLEYVDAVAARYPDRPAFHFLGVVLTFRQIMDHANRVANALKERGLGRGDVVAVCMPNTPQYVVSILGSLKAGCAVSGLSPLLTADEMAYQLNDCQAKALIIVDILFEKPFAAAAGKVPGLKTVVATGLADYLPAFKQFLGKLLKKVPTGQVTPLDGKEVVWLKEVLKRYPAEAPGVAVQLEDTCFLQYTGGTTGAPKGAVLTHRNIMSGIAQYDEVYKMKQGAEVYCSALPMFHIAGLVLSLHGMYYGATQVLIPDPRNVDLILKEMIARKPTLTVNVPTMHLMIAAREDARQVDWDNIEIVFSGAAPFSADGVKTLEKTGRRGQTVRAVRRDRNQSAYCHGPAPHSQEGRIGGAAVAFDPGATGRPGDRGRAGAHGRRGRTDCPRPAGHEGIPEQAGRDRQCHART